MMFDIITKADVTRSISEAQAQLGLEPEAPLSTEALQVYWRDPAAYEADREAGQAQINSLFAPHEARIRAMQEARWAAEEQSTC